MLSADAVHWLQLKGIRKYWIGHLLVSFEWWTSFSLSSSSMLIEMSCFVGNTQKKEEMIQQCCRTKKFTMCGILMITYWQWRSELERLQRWFPKKAYLNESLIRLKPCKLGEYIYFIPYYYSFRQLRLSTS